MIEQLPRMRHRGVIHTPSNHGVAGKGQQLTRSEAGYRLALAELTGGVTFFGSEPLAVGQAEIYVQHRR